MPVSTYRLQLQPGFGFADAAASAGYLADLGVTHVYLSPILQATPGSTHGYDVVDHSRVSEELGGEAAFRDMAGRFRGLGLGVIVDIVPNHMAVPVPESLNRPLWSVLRDGTGSPFAGWFDVDWDAQDGRLLHAGPGRPGQRLPRRPERVDDAGPAASRCSGTSTTCCPSAPGYGGPAAARRCWPPSITGWPTGAWPRRSSTGGGSSTSAR